VAYVRGGRRDEVWACRENGRMHDRTRDISTDAVTGLLSLRRYTWWAVPGSPALFVLFVFGFWVIDQVVPVWTRVIGGMAGVRQRRRGSGGRSSAGRAELRVVAVRAGVDADRHRDVRAPATPAHHRPTSRS
jgi:hypothetical protein